MSKLSKFMLMICFLGFFVLPGVAAETADAIYTDGDIITMASDVPLPASGKPRPLTWRDS